MLSAGRPRGPVLQQSVLCNQATAAAQATSSHRTLVVVEGAVLAGCRLGDLAISLVERAHDLRVALALLCCPPDLAPHRHQLVPALYTVCELEQAQSRGTWDFSAIMFVPLSSKCALRVPRQQQCASQISSGALNRQLSVDKRN